MFVLRPEERLASDESGRYRCPAMLLLG